MDKIVKSIEISKGILSFQLEDVVSGDIVDESVYEIEFLDDDALVEVNASPCDSNNNNSPVNIEIPNNEIESNTSPEKITKGKKRKNDANWQSNKRKSLRQAGKCYISARKKFVPAKTIKTTKNCLEQCIYKCKLITEYERQKIFEKFYELDSNGKRNFLLQSTERMLPVGRRAGKTTENSKKKYTFKYYFSSVGNKIQVCKQFFLGSLSISQKPIYNAHSQKDELTGIPAESKQGKHRKKVISEDIKETIRNHINSFPKIESHYCRKSSSRSYLESHLSISQMYELYKEKMEKESEVQIVKESMYREIFVNEFNLSFHKPKKDRCDLCEEFKVLKNSTTVHTEIKKTFENHQKEKEACRANRQVDRENNIPVLCFDLQNVLTCPKADISSFFYQSKLNVYNLTAHLYPTNEVFCCVWNESIMGRNGNDIGAFIKILKKVLQQHSYFQRIILWCDSCVPQNRNSIISYAIINFLKNNSGLKNIIMKFSTPGHSCIQEIDNVHSCLEIALRKREYYSPISLIRILLKVKYKKRNIFILQMTCEDFKDFKTCSSYLNFKLVPYSKVVELRFSQFLTMIEFKTSHLESEYKAVGLKKLNPERKNKINKVDCDILPDPQRNKIKAQITEQKSKCFSAMLKFMPKVDTEFYLPLINKTNTQ